MVFFSFLNNFNILFHFILACIFSWWEIFCASIPLILQTRFLFFSAFFEDFFFILIFFMLAVICISVLYLFVFLDSYPGSFMDLWLIFCHSFWKVLGHYHTKYFFCSILSFFSFWFFNYASAILLISSCSSWVVLLKTYFSSAHWFEKFLLTYIQVHCFFLWPCPIYWWASQNILHFASCIFLLYHFLLLLSWTSISLLILPICCKSFTFFSRSLHLLNHSYLKFCLISESASVVCFVSSDHVFSVIFPCLVNFCWQIHCIG